MGSPDVGLVVAGLDGVRVSSGWVVADNLWTQSWLRRWLPA